MKQLDSLLGVVLCGGQSKRMGSDKGLLQLHGKPWAQIMADKLKTLGLPFVISINGTQVKDYSEVFDAAKLVVDQLPMHASLNGLLTVHRQFPDKDILLLACDIIDMQESVLQHLTNAYRQNEADFFAYEEDNFFQPLCAIYRAAAVENLDAQLVSGRLASYSFQYILNNGSTYRLKTKATSAFANYNTPGL